MLACPESETNEFREPAASGEMDDKRLLSLVAAGDTRAFTLLYDRYSTLLYSIAYSVCNDREEAQDVLQHVFMNLPKKAALFDPAMGRPAGWLSVMVRNRSIDQCRLRKRFESYADRIRLCSDPPRGGGPQVALYRDEVELLHGAIAELPPPQREAVELAYLHNLTHPEICERLSQPLGTVKARIRRALLKLRKSLEESALPVIRPCAALQP